MYLLYLLRTVGEEILKGTFVVGSVERVWATSNLLTEEERAVVGPVLRVWVFKRAIINGIEYQSSLYKRTTARNNFTVVFKDRGKSRYGSVSKFLKCQAKCTSMQRSSKCSCSLPFFFIALVQKMRNHATQLPSYKGMRVIQNVTRVTLGDVISIPLSAIKKKCMRIDLDSDVIFVTHMATQISLPVSLYSLCYTLSSINFVCLVHIPYALENSNLSSPKKNVFLGPTSV